MNNNKIVIYLLTAMFCSVVKGQNLDSLETMLKTNKNLTIEKQLDLYDKLSWAYINTDADKAKHLSRQGIVLAKKIKNDLMCGILYHHMGIACYHKSEIDSAWHYFKTAESFSKKANDDFRLDRIYIAYAILYDTENQQEKAINVLLTRLPELEKKKDGDLIRTVYGNLGALYLYIHNYKLSEKYFTLCAEKSLEAKDDWKLSQSYNGLIDIYMQKNEYQKALDYTDKALVVAKRCGDTQSEALGYGKKSEIYYTYFKDLAKANDFALKGLEIARKGASLSTISGLLITLSNISYQKKDYQKSREYAQEALQTDTTDQKNYENTTINLVKSGIYLNDKENTLKYLQKYYEIVEARSKKDLHQYSIDSEKKYQAEKKEQKIATLLKQKKLYGIITFTTLLSLLTLTLGLYLRHKNTKVKKQLAEHKIAQLEQEKQLIATQAVLEGEAAERIRLSRDLHDGLGGMLSAVKLNLFDIKQGVIVEAEDISRFNKVMEMLDKSMHELRRVAHNMMPESLSRYGLKVSLEDFCRSFSKVHFHFFGTEKRLDSKAETTIYRVVYELVNNAVKHANAKNINVQLVQESDRISVTVQDDGIGFNLQATNSGNGLQNIENRIKAVNGTIHIFSAPDKGTEIAIEINLKELENGQN